MDTAQIDTTITFLTAVAHALEYAGAATFLIVAGYCAGMHALALFFVLLCAVLKFARRCTVHMLKHLRAVLEELHKWPSDLHAALHAPQEKPRTTPEAPNG